MNEDFLHYLWKFKRFGKNEFKTIDNESIKVLDFGQHNLNSGPDFKNARVAFGDIVLAGHIEIHIKSSDWNLHGHQYDENYNNVILHVVLRHDKEIYIRGKKIPTLELHSMIPVDDYEKYQTKFRNEAILCGNSLSQLSTLDWQSQFDAMLVNRLSRKLKENSELLDLMQTNYSKLFDVLVGKALGGPVNKDGFELLVEVIPRNLEAKLENSEDTFKEVFLGLANLIPQEEDFQQWNYYKQLLNLTQVSSSVWKYGRLLPKGFPKVRVKQFSNLMRLKNQILSNLNTNLSPKNWFELLQSNNKSNLDKECNISNGMAIKILINAILSFIDVVEMRKSNQTNFERHLNLLELVKAEKNNVTKRWTNFGVSNQSMYQSQALIELHNEYCIKKQCLNCKFGVKFMA